MFVKIGKLLFLLFIWFVIVLIIGDCQGEQLEEETKKIVAQIFFNKTDLNKTLDLTQHQSTEPNRHLPLMTENHKSGSNSQHCSKYLPFNTETCYLCSCENGHAHVMPLVANTIGLNFYAILSRTVKLSVCCQSAVENINCHNFWTASAKLKEEIYSTFDISSPPYLCLDRFSCCVFFIM